MEDIQYNRLDMLIAVEEAMMMSGLERSIPKMPREIKAYLKDLDILHVQRVGVLVDANA